jgi:DNA repair protein RadC
MNRPKKQGRRAGKAAGDVGRITAIGENNHWHPNYPQEWGLVALREFPEEKPLCDNHAMAADYWRRHVLSHPYFNAECECLVVIVLDTSRNARGHYVVSVGILDTVLCHPREVFRQAIIAGASAIVVAHNHPSGDPRPSANDVKVTRGLIRAGNLLKIDVLDHIIMESKRRGASSVSAVTQNQPVRVE